MRGDPDVSPPVFRLEDVSSLGCFAPVTFRPQQFEGVLRGYPFSFQFFTDSFRFKDNISFIKRKI